MKTGMIINGGLDAGLLGFSRTVNSGITAFEMEYGHWVEEQHKQNCDLRNALNAHISDVELRMLVDTGLDHYTKFFRMKASAAKADVFYVMFGMWKASAERFFSWIGGFRPSELLKVLVPQLDPMTEQQLMGVYNLQQSCQQAEDALTQGMDKLHQNLADSVAAGHLVEGSYLHMISAMEKLEALEIFVNQADHLRKQTLQHMYQLLTVRQAAQGLLALGEYFQRLQALSTLWATRTGITAFEKEYGRWVEEQHKQNCDLRNALNAHISDVELQMLVDTGLDHYTNFFRMKASSAKADVFFVMSGMWKTSAEHFFSWIGGFRPSELLKVLVPQLEPMTEQQLMGVYNLQQSCQQAEDTLTQGMDKLQQNLADIVAAGQLVEGSYPHMISAMEKLEALEIFVNQADLLRKETLEQMYQLLTVRQAARGLLALGEYFQRLRALSTLWATRPRVFCKSLL